MIDKLLEEYRDKFGESFPLMLFMSSTNEEISKEIKKCIDKGKPFETESGAIY